MSKNLDADLKIILLDHQNNYVKNSSWAILQKVWQQLSILCNYFESDKIKFFSDLYVVKFLSISKIVFSCINIDLRINKLQVITYAHFIFLCNVKLILLYIVWTRLSPSCVLSVLVALVFAKLDFDDAAMIQMFRVAPIMKWHLYSTVSSAIKLNIIRILFCVIASKIQHAFAR